MLDDVIVGHDNTGKFVDYFVKSNDGTMFDLIWQVTKHLHVDPTIENPYIRTNGDGYSVEADYDSDLDRGTSNIYTCRPYWPPLRPFPMLMTIGYGGCSEKVARARPPTNIFAPIGEDDSGSPWPSRRRRHRLDIGGH